LHLYTPIEGIAHNASTSPLAGYVYGRGMACHALLPGLLHRKRFAMTGSEESHASREHRYSNSSLHVIAKAKPEAIQDHCNKVITYHNYSLYKAINL
jgi:hypothetical protein